MKLSALALLLALPAAAHAEGTASKALTGFDWIVSPGAYFGTGGGDPGFAISDHIGYRLHVGPIVVSPGLSVPFFAVPDAFSIGVLGEVQVHYPIGIVSPYAELGVGAGFITGAVGTTGLGLKAGAGLMVFFTENFGLGAEVAYDKIDVADFIHLVVPIHFWF